jgi:hypothetical protein
MTFSTDDLDESNARQIEKAERPRHFIPYGSYIANCGYIGDSRFPSRQTEFRVQVTCGGCQFYMTNLGDLPPVVGAPHV